MAKSLYSALFDWIVFRTNHALLNNKDLEDNSKVTTKNTVLYPDFSRRLVKMMLRELRYTTTADFFPLLNTNETFVSDQPPTSGSILVESVMVLIVSKPGGQSSQERCS